MDLLVKMMTIETRKCMSIIELALRIEYSAFDLYRTMAENTEENDAKEAFLTIAQAEKKHMKKLIDTVALCQ